MFQVCKCSVLTYCLLASCFIIDSASKAVNVQVPSTIRSDTVSSFTRLPVFNPGERIRYNGKNFKRKTAKPIQTDNSWPNILTDSKERFENYTTFEKAVNAVGELIGINEALRNYDKYVRNRVCPQQDCESILKTPVKAAVETLQSLFLVALVTIIEIMVDITFGKCCMKAK